MRRTKEENGSGGNKVEKMRQKERVEIQMGR